tara:strand:- start:48 stop:251 length:204 start_codon:yes stop_codon:yes gene_type:complete
MVTGAYAAIILQTILNIFFVRSVLVVVLEIGQYVRITRKTTRETIPSLLLLVPTGMTMTGTSLMTIL